MMQQNKENKFNTNNKMPKKPGLKSINKSTINRLMSYIFKHKIKLIMVFICILMSTGASVASSLFIKTLIDSYIMPLVESSNPEFSGLFHVIIIMAILYMAGVIATYVYNRIMAVMAQSILKDIRDEMFEHMQTFPIRYFDTHSHGDVMSYYTNDTDTLRQMISQTIPQMFSSLITIVAVFISMLVISGWLSLFVVIFLFLMLRVIKVIGGKSGRFFMKQQKTIAEVNGYIEEMINGAKVIKVFCHEDKTKEEFDQKNNELCECATNANTFANILMPIMGNMGYILYVLVAIIGGAMVIFGAPNFKLIGIDVLTIGGVGSFLQLSRSFVNPIGQMSQQINMIAMALAGAERIFNLLDEKSEEDNGYVKLVNAKWKNENLVESNERTGLWAWKHPHQDGSVTYTQLKGEVVMENVDFGYVENKMVLHDVSLYANPGQKIAFVGATGAGKTTITNLINRFYDIADGKIRYDGININKICKQDLRKSLGVVLQETNLFTGTVMENIRYGKLDATNEECIKSAKLANAHNFITMLPNGYDTEISGDGEGLSQGQRQLISIARAAVADPPVMILDEATSSIDTRTEAHIQKGMDALMKGRTVFVIAHRLSTVQNSNVIMVLEQGHIIEKGTHQSLIDEKGKYYQLYTGAFELE